MEDNVSGISAVTQFIVKKNTANTYLHFRLGKRDAENRDLLWFLRILERYSQWIRLTLCQNDILIHFNLALTVRSVLRDSPLLLVARLMRKPMIIHLHGGEYLKDFSMPAWMRCILRLALSGKHPTIVLSDIEKKAVERRLRIGRVFVLPNCIDVTEASQFNRKYDKSKNLTILYMGRIEAAKGIVTILQAFERLKEKGMAFTFALAGAGSLEELYAQKFKELLGARFCHRGVVSGAQKVELLKESDILVLPSINEGLPIVLLESMSFGLVPICTNVGGIPEVVKDGTTGVLLDSDSSLLHEELASALQRLDTDREYLCALGRNARQYALTNSDADAYIGRLNEIYDYGRNYERAK
jgi:glycosyltransferase involved in cell wall biosynthesis